MYHRTEIIFESPEYNAKHLQKNITYFLARTLRKMPNWKLIEMCRGISGLEKLTNANRSVSSVNDRLFPVELREIVDWKSMSKYMLHSNIGKALKGLSAGNLVHIPYIAASLFPKYLPMFLDVLSAERILKRNKNTSEFPRINSCCFRQAHSSSSVRVQSAK